MRDSKANNKGKVDFHGIFDALPTPFLVLSPDCRIVTANQAFLDTTMRRGEELIGRSIFDAFPGQAEGESALRASLNKVVETGEADFMPVTRYDIPRPAEVGGGFEERHWRPINTPMPGRDGRVAFIIHRVEDVTDSVMERRADRAALRVSEEISRLIIESATEYAIFSMDLNGVVNTWNSGAQNLLGYEDFEIIGRSGILIFTPEDRARGAPEEEMRNALQQGRADDERWHMRRDGSRFWATGMLMPLRNDEGEVEGYFKILRDRTGQRQVEEAEAHRTRRLEILTTVAADLLGTRSPEEAMPGLFRAMNQDLAVDAMLSFNCDEEAGVMRLATSAGIPGDVVVEADDLCGKAFATRKMAYASGLGNSQDPSLAFARSIGLDAYACYPMIANGRLLGALSFGTRSRAGFSDEDLAFFGTLTQYVTVVRERRRVEQALRTSESRLRLAIDAGRMAVWESELATDTISSSPELNRLLGLPEDARPSTEEIRKRYYPGDRDKLLETAKAALESGESYAEAEFRVVWPDGSVHWLLLRAELEGDEAGRPARAVGVALDITERKKEEERRRLLTHELNHRVKNTLAAMQALASQSFRNARSLDEARESFLERLTAMAGAHDILTRESWEGAELRDIAAIAAHRFGAGARVRLSGPRLRLVPRTAIALAMALHELATNAVKYGALRTEHGEVALTWSIAQRGGEQRLLMRWEEQGGPPVVAPARRGFGSRLIESGLSRELGGEVRILFAPEGIVCLVDAPVPAAEEQPVQ